MTTHSKFKLVIAILLFIVFGFISGCVSSNDSRSAEKKIQERIMSQPLNDAGQAGYLTPVYQSLKDKQYNTAINQAENLKSAHPNDADLFYLQGIAYYKKNDPTSALRYFEKTISINSKRGDAYYYLAVMYFRLDKSKKALNSINTAINNEKTAFQLMNQEKLRHRGDWTVEGRRANLFYLRALINEDLGKNDAALSDVDTAISTSPYKSPAHFKTRGNLYFFKKSNFYLAYNDFQKAVEIDPEDGFTWHYLGLIDSYMGRYDKAIFNLNKAVELEPDRLMEALGDAGVAYWLKGDKSSALKAIGEVIRKKPNYDMYYHLAYFQHLMGNPVQARINFKKAEQLESGILNIYSWKLAEQLPKSLPSYHFYQQEYETAKKYLGAGEIATVNTRKNTTPTLKITSLTLEPDPVPVNTIFDIKINFKPDIPGAGNNKFPIVFYFKIYKNNKKLFTSKDITIDSFNGKTNSWTQHMNPVPVKGGYSIKTFVKYKKLLAEKNITLTIK